MFRRLDAPYWARWKFYPLGLLTMPTRFILQLLSIIMLCLILKILTIGHDFEKGPIPDGLRKRLIGTIYMAVCGFEIFLAGMTTDVTYKDVDYSFYLGEGYKEKYKDIKRTSTIVSNHCSWLDALIMINIFMPAFTPTAAFKTVPVFSTTCEVLDSIYINRGADEASRQKIVKDICDRQNAIEETGKYAPLLLFPEGATTNNSALLKFRRGAFIGEKRVKPTYMKFPHHTMSPDYCVIDFWPMLIMNLCWRGLKCHVNIMPDFEPNEYLFETHKDKGTERWEIFAWAVRDIISKTGDFKLCNIKLQDKVSYYNYMMKYPGAADPSKDEEVKERFILAESKKDDPIATFNEGYNTFDKIEAK